MIRKNAWAVSFYLRYRCISRRIAGDDSVVTGQNTAGRLEIRALACHIWTYREAFDLLKSYLFQRVHFLKKGVLLYYDDKRTTVYLADDEGNVAKMNMGELKRWVRCQCCGAEGFVDGDEPEFVNASICKKCQKLPSI